MEQKLGFEDTESPVVSTDPQQRYRRVVFLVDHQGTGEILDMAAELVEQEIVSKAREEAQRTTEQARRAIESEKQAAIAELRRETADLAVKAAGALIEANLDDERNRKLVEDLIAGIPSGN